MHAAGNYAGAVYGDALVEASAIGEPLEYSARDHAICEDEREACRHPGSVPNDNVDVAQYKRQPDAENTDESTSDGNEQFERLLRKRIHVRRVVHAAEAQAKMRNEAGEKRRLQHDQLIERYVSNDCKNERRKKAAQNDCEDVADCDGIDGDLPR